MRGAVALHPKREAGGRVPDDEEPTVYRGRDRSTGQMVAIKVVWPTMARNPVLLKRFEQEFRAAW